MGWGGGGGGFVAVLGWGVGGGEICGGGEMGGEVFLLLFLYFFSFLFFLFFSCEERWREDDLSLG